MRIAWGVVVTLLSLLCWGGQLVSAVASEPAQDWGLSERESNVEAAFWADVRGEAVWDALTLWTLVVAGVLLILDHETWAYFGLVGGGTYLYFAGRGILTRREMIARGQRVGDDRGVRTAFVALGVWGIMGFITIVAAANALEAA